MRDSYVAPHNRQLIVVENPDGNSTHRPPGGSSSSIFDTLTIPDPLFPALPTLSLRSNPLVPPSDSSSPSSSSVHPISAATLRYSSFAFSLPSSSESSP